MKFHIVTKIKCSKIKIEMMTKQVKELKADKYLTWIPTNARIDKTYCGIGGTTAELRAKRNSIILMPSFRATQQKTTNVSNLYNVDELYGIYGGHNDIDGLMNYLNSDVTYKKVIMTMSRKSLTILMKVAELFPEIFSYNLLLDEVDQIQDDGFWREDLTLCYDLVSIWKQKAFLDKTNGSVSVISATGVDLISFESISKLPLWKIPSQENRNNFPVNIIETKEVEAVAATLINESSSNRNFIFYNNVDGSKRIIEAIDKKNRSRIYCGVGSENKAREYYSTDLNNFIEYNFFTRAYFRAVDFNDNGEVFIITDPNSLHAGLTVEDIVQAIGRIRKTIKKVTIIMDTKENKSKLKDMPLEKVQQWFRDIANQHLGIMRSLDAMGELTDSYYEKIEAVRKNLKGDFVINWAWVEGKVKNAKFDNVAYESIDNMEKALHKYDIKTSVIDEPIITYRTVREEEDWKSIINFVLEVINKDTAGSTLLLSNFNDNEQLILEGFNKLGVDVVKKTESKYKLKELIKEFDTKDRKESVGITVANKIEPNIFIPNKELKNLLQEIYNLKGYESKAKATDLKDFFLNVKATFGYVNGRKTRGMIVSNPKYKITK